MTEHQQEGLSQSLHYSRPKECQTHQFLHTKSHMYTRVFSKPLRRLSSALHKSCGADIERRLLVQCIQCSKNLSAGTQILADLVEAAYILQRIQDRIDFRVANGLVYC